MNARELLEKLEYENRNGLRWLFSSDSKDRQTVLRALSLLASVEGSGEEIVRELSLDSQYLGEFNPTHVRAQFAKAAAHILALRAELASVKAHAEAMAVHLNDGIQVDVDQEDGTQSPRSEWDFVANELVAAYRAANPKE